MHLICVLLYAISVVTSTNRQLWDYGREKSNYFGMDPLQRGPFGRGELNTFSDFMLIVHTLNKKLGNDDTQREYRWTYSFGAIFTDHRTFTNRATNYETFFERNCSS